MKKYVKLILYELVIGLIWRHHKKLLEKFLAAKEGTQVENEYGDRYSLWWKVEDHLKSLLALHIKKSFPND